jgi:hypothetical protein
MTSAQTKGSNELAPGVTGRSRRRRRVITAGKENTNVTNHLDSDNITFSGAKKINKDTGASIQYFRPHLEHHLKLSDVSLWENLIITSISSSLDLATKSTTAGLLMIQERADKILQSCRSFISEASKSESASSLALIGVALHGIRALCLHLSCIETHSSLMVRLLYHIIHASHKTYVKCTPTDPIVLDEAVCYATIAYYALGHLLQQSHVEEQGITYGFEQSSTPSDALAFPKPCKTSGSNRKSLPLTLPIKEVLSIGIQSNVNFNTLLHRILQPQCSITDSRTKKMDVYAGGMIKSSFLSSIGLNTLASIMCTNAAPWIMMDSKPKNILTYNKQFHRMLWDTVGKQNHLTPEECLYFRGIAVRLLFGDTSSKDYLLLDVVEALEDTKFCESACSYARKAALSFGGKAPLQLPVHKEHPLYTFHESVGAALDLFCSSSCSMSYVEYCACRAQHTAPRDGTPCNDSTCFFDSLVPHRFVHQSCKHENSLVMALLFLCMDVVTRLENPITKSSDVYVSDALRIVSQFEGLLQTETLVNPTRVYQLMQTVPLHRKLNDLLPSAVKLEDPDHLSILHVASEVLLRNLAPLALVVAATDPVKAIAFIDASIDNTIRAVSILDQLGKSKHAESEAFRSQADDVMVATVESIVSRDNKMPPSKSCIERVAKVRLLSRSDFD